jgi:hypothetical protein
MAVCIASYSPHYFLIHSIFLPHFNIVVVHIIHKIIFPFSIALILTAAAIIYKNMCDRLIFEIFKYF